MTVNKRIVCLAYSRQSGGRCIAGKVLVDRFIGGWIRPISNREDEAVRPNECRYSSSFGSHYPKVMDVIDVPLLEHKPRYHQQENWQLDPKKKWRKVGRVNWDDLEEMTDPAAPLWNGGTPGLSQRTDRIHSNRAAKFSSSLRLIHVDKLFLSVLVESTQYGTHRRRVQGRFIHCELMYRLWVTDWHYEKYYLSKNDGEYEIGECYLTVSLSKEYRGYAYKLIAAIIERHKVH